MDEIVLVAVLHSLHDLPKEHLCSCLVEPALLLHILEQFPALQKLHDDGDLHVLEREAVVHLHDVLMVE